MQGPRLIPRLREIQEASGYLPRAKMEALGAELMLPLHRIHEVVSFFPHLRLKPGPAATIRVCRDLACEHAGAMALKQRLEALASDFGSESVGVEWSSCLGQCDRAPAIQAEFERPGDHSVIIDQDGRHAARTYDKLKLDIDYFLSDRESVADLIAPLPENRPAWKLDYTNQPGGRLPEFSAVRSFAARLRDADDPASRDAVLEALNEQMRNADLRGMGGAGVPTFRKWQDVRSARGDRRYVICNADESEPLTFKDREILLRTPDIVLEGMIFGALFTGATSGYVYVRHEYPAQIEAMQKAIDRAYEAGVLGKDVMGTGQNLDIEVFVSPGGYVCGEQSALIEAIEEKRSEPRNKPPQIETNGLYDCPTLLNNVETFSWVPAIAHYGGAWFADSGVTSGPWYGRPGRRSNAAKGMRFFSLCGDVRRPGVHEVPNGTTLGELIRLCGGMIDGLPLFALAPSGPSGGFLPAQLTRSMIAPEFRNAFPSDRERLNVEELPLDLDEFRTLGLMLGAGMMVYADRPGQRPDMLAQALSATRFYRRESCGKCVPCRVGCQKLVEIGESLNSVDRTDPASVRSIAELVADLAETMELTSICGLGTSAPKPLSSYVALFLTPDFQKAQE
jgi:NADH:ubiquinone oxidoreductase subunit F (NADH-binding)